MPFAGERARCVHRRKGACALCHDAAPLYILQIRVSETFVYRTQSVTFGAPLTIHHILVKYFAADMIAHCSC